MVADGGGGRLAAEMAAAENKFRQLDEASTLTLPLPKVLQLADWVWGQFYDGATLKPAERGRLASKLLRHHNQDGDELVTSLTLKDFLKWYQTVRSAMFAREQSADAQNAQQMAPNSPAERAAPEGAPSAPSLEDCTPLKTPLHPPPRAAPLTLSTSNMQSPQPKVLTPPASPAEPTPLVTKSPQVISNGTPKVSPQVLPRQDVGIEPMRSSPPARPMAKQEQTAGGASLATPFRGERPSYAADNSYDSIPGATSPVLTTAVAGNTVLTEQEGADKELAEERKRGKRLMKIQERLQQDLNEAKQENTLLALENQRLLRQLQFASDGHNDSTAQQMMSMHRKMDELVMQHSEVLDSKNAQIIKAVKECQDAHETIELLENRLRNHESLPGGGGGAERDAEMHALHEEVAAKEKRIASLQASLVSLRKIVNKFEKRDDDDKVARLEQEKASLESKNVQLANSLRGMEKKFAVAVRAAETAAGLVEKAALKAAASRAPPQAHIQQDGDDNVMLNKKLRETQRLLLEAYAESDMIRAEMVETAQNQANKEKALEEKLRQVVAFAYTEREELTKRCNEQEHHIRQLRAHLEPVHSTHHTSTAATGGAIPPAAVDPQQQRTPPPAGNSIQAWMHSVA